MKHLFFALITFISLVYPLSSEAKESKAEIVSTSNYVVFRTTQKLRSNDGREIYLYPNRTCELFYGGRLEVRCTYRLQDGEVRLLDENGETVYKGSYRMTSDGINLSSLTLGGTSYFRKR